MGKTGAELVDWWVTLASKYPVYLLEDPADENDFDSHAALTAKIGDKVEIVGDDLYCTNPKIVAKGVEKKATNAMLLKVNQIGSISRPSMPTSCALRTAGASSAPTAA